MTKLTVLSGILIIMTLVICMPAANVIAVSDTNDNIQVKEQQAKDLIDRCSTLLSNATISTQNELTKCDSDILDLSPNAVAEMIKGPVCNDPRLNNYLTVRNLWDKIGQ